MTTTDAPLVQLRPGAGLPGHGDSGTDPTAPSRAACAELAARWGRTGLAPFLTAYGVTNVALLGRLGVAGYAQHRRWAITTGDVVAPEPVADLALRDYLDVLAERRLRPAFLAAADPEPYLRRGMHVSEVADEAVLDLHRFTLDGPERANVRHAVSSARRLGLSLAAYERGHDVQLREISREWLRTKRGGEYGFTLSRHRDVPGQLSAGRTDLWVVLDGAADVQAWCTWRHYRDGRGRVLDIMRRRPSAPNPAMDFLIASALLHYRDIGVDEASLASVPRAHGSAAERFYPTRSLRAYKQKFAPSWQVRWLAVSSAWQRPAALTAIAGVYSPDGLRHALLRNR